MSYRDTMYCFVGEFLCCKTIYTSNIIKQLISYTIIFLPLVIGITIVAIYGNRWEEDKYKKFKKPNYNPSSYLFNIVWSMLYLLVGIAYSVGLYDSRCIPDKLSKCGTTVYYRDVKYWIIPCLSLLFNFMYIPVFFEENGLYNGFIIIILSLFFAILTLVQFYLQSNFTNIRIITLTFIPYIIWLIFITYLSYDLYMLNSL